MELAVCRMPSARVRCTVVVLLGLALTISAQDPVISRFDKGIQFLNVGNRVKGISDVLIGTFSVRILKFREIRPLSLPPARCTKEDTHCTHYREHLVKKNIELNEDRKEINALAKSCLNEIDKLRYSSTNRNKRANRKNKSKDKYPHMELSSGAVMHDSESKVKRVKQ